MDERGDHAGLDSGMVNEYLRAITGEDITAKDFRTWHGTVCAAEQLDACGESKIKAEINKNIVAAIQEVARNLGNRPATCRKYYVHPVILDLYSSGKLRPFMSKRSGGRNLAGLAPPERCVLRILLSNERHR